jgi:saccharopepsin
MDELTYITNISIGAPSQSFSLLLSVSDSDLLIPSIYCLQECENHQRYKAYQSSLHTPHSTAFKKDYLRLSSEGILSEDTIDFVGHSIPKQMFLEADTINNHFTSRAQIDGILGLAPTIEASPLNHYNPFLNMISQNVLDRNLFSLKLPRGPDDAGEILFGAIDHDMYLDSLKSLPLVHQGPVKSPALGGGRWAVSATSLNIGSKFTSLAGFKAVFETDYPFIGLPENQILLIDRSLGMKRMRGDHYPDLVDCAKRRHMDNLTITLGDEDFVLSPWEYTIEIGSGDERRCLSAFMPLPESEEKHILLGSAFLRAFYTVFDLDRRVVSCKYL